MPPSPACPRHHVRPLLFALLLGLAELGWALATPTAHAAPRSGVAAGCPGAAGAPAADPPGAGQSSPTPPARDPAAEARAFGMQMRAEGAAMAVTEQAMARARLGPLAHAFNMAGAVAMKAQSREKARSIMADALAANGLVQDPTGSIPLQAQIDPARARQIVQALKQPGCLPGRS